MVTALWLYLASTEDLRDPALTRYYESLLTEDECARRQHFSTDRLREQFLLTRGLVRRALSCHSGIPPTAWRFGKNSYGRPMISGPPGAPRLNFNLSNADGLVACVVSAWDEIGVDVEVLDQTTETTAIAEQYFSFSETATLKTLSRPLQHYRFFQYWTLKEAYVKARGIGLYMDLDGFSFDLTDGKPIRNRFDSPAEDEVSAWHFYQFRPTDRHVVAVACRASFPLEFKMVTILSCLALKPLFFMVCASETGAMSNTEIKMPAKITVSFWFMISPS